MFVPFPIEKEPLFFLKKMKTFSFGMLLFGLVSPLETESAAFWQEFTEDNAYDVLLGVEGISGDKMLLKQTL